MILELQNLTRHMGTKQQKNDLIILVGILVLFLLVQLYNVYELDFLLVKKCYIIFIEILEMEKQRLATDMENISHVPLNTGAVEPKLKDCCVIC